MRQFVKLIPLALLMLCSTALADELPARPTAEQALPTGAIVKLSGVEHKCFTVPEWRQMGALIVDYRTLLAWAAMAEGVLVERTLARDGRTLEAAELRRALLAMQGAHAAEVDRLTDAWAASERRRRWQAWGLGGLAVLGLATALVVGIDAAQTK
jgi:hypothetical protein